MLVARTDFENTLLLKVKISKNIDQNALRKAKTETEFWGILGGCHASDTTGRPYRLYFQANAKNATTIYFAVVI